MDIKDAASKIFAFLSGKDSANSWQIKTALHMPMALVYLALGALESQGKITLQATGINYAASIKK